MKNTERGGREACFGSSSRTSESMSHPPRGGVSAALNAKQVSLAALMRMNASCLYSRYHSFHFSITLSG